jgi:cytochrome P450
VVYIPKWTGHSSAEIDYDGKTIALPPETKINLGSYAMHYKHEYWGPDVREFVPERWDAKNEDSYLAQNKNMEGLTVAGLEYDTVHKPVRGAYLPFSDGHRSCIGKKFAQTEFVAVITLLFSEFEVSLAKTSPDESDESVRKRAWKALEDSCMELSLSMRVDVPLTFHRRKL